MKTKIETLTQLSILTTGIITSEYFKDISENIETPSVCFMSETGEYEDVECAEISYSVDGFTIMFKVFENEPEAMYMETWARDCEYETSACFDIDKIDVETIVNIIQCETYMFFVD
jgi:hypothetical protein